MPKKLKMQMQQHLVNVVMLYNVALSHYAQYSLWTHTVNFILWIVLFKTTAELGQG